MTHALHDIMHTDGYRKDDPETLISLVSEIRDTAEEIRLGSAESDDMENVINSSRHLMKDLGAVGLRGIFALWEATAVTNDPTVEANARRATYDKFPVNENLHEFTRNINSRSREEFELALAKAREEGWSFGRALTYAETKLDEEYDNGFDEVIVKSHDALHEVEKERRQKAIENRKAQENRRREELRQVYQDSTDKAGDDTNTTGVFNPFSDDEEPSRVKVA